MKPYKFKPYLKTTLWGGYQIAPFKGIFTAPSPISARVRKSVAWQGMRA